MFPAFNLSWSWLAKCIPSGRKKNLPHVRKPSSQRDRVNTPEVKTPGPVRVKTLGPGKENTQR